MNAPALDIALYSQKIAELGLVPRGDTLTGLCSKWISEGSTERKDDELAPLMAAELEFVYAQVYETVYPEFGAINGDLGVAVDSSVPATATHYKSWTIDFAGYAAWIGDDGRVMPGSSAKATPSFGYIADAGHAFDFTVFELERAATAGVPLPTYKQNAAKRAHDAKMNWTWLFGAPEKQIHGIFTHPNAQVALAPLGSAGTFGDNRDRLIENKTNAEILADVETAVDTVARSTIRAHHTATVVVPFVDMTTMVRRKLSSSDGTVTSLWDYIQSNYGSPKANRPAVQFVVLNECDPAYRTHPEHGTDTSGLRGRVWLSIPAATKQQLAFILARPFTQRTPQERDLVIKTITISTFGGCRCEIPLALLRLDFLAADNATAAP